VLQDPDSSAAAQRGTRRTLVRVLETALRLAHPIIPYITEEIWQRIGPLAGANGESIMTQPYPVCDDTKIDANAVAEMEWMMSFILGIRRIRGEMNIPPRKPLPILLQDGQALDQERLDRNQRDLAALASIETITWLRPGDDAPESATALVGEMKLLIPLAGLIDKDAELQRLDKELAKLRKELDKTRNKLQNPKFVDRAPADVVAKEKDRMAEFESSIENLENQADKIRKLD